MVNGLSTIIFDLITSRITKVVLLRVVLLLNNVLLLVEQSVFLPGGDVKTLLDLRQDLPLVILILAPFLPSAILIAHGLGKHGVSVKPRVCTLARH